MNSYPPAVIRASELSQDIYALFVERAAQSPNSLAVIDDQGPCTYGALQKRANEIGHFLRAQGLAAETPIGVVMERRVDLVAVLLGILQAGCAYVPFDPRDPADRIRRMLVSSGTTVVIGDRPLLDKLHSASDAIVDQKLVAFVVDDIHAPENSGDAPRAALGLDRLAYLLFTSGSTGEPKAVEVKHGNVVALLASARECLGFSAADRYLASSTIAFDASITELFLPLTTGASLLLRDRAVLLDPRTLAQDVREHGVTVVQTGPSVWARILAELPDFPRIRVAITHGEAVAPDLAAKLCAYGESVWNLYGPTETTVWATGHLLSPSNAAGYSHMSAPIGKPLPHVSLIVIDESGRPLGAGAEGELCIGGPGLARGYRNNPQLTAERFVEIEGARIYRTGDLGMRDADGVVHYLGRNDDQMKIRGIRIEPSEVEAALLRDERIAQAAATWYPNQAGSRSIVAAVVLRSATSCEADELHRSLERWIPKSMIPSRFLFVPWLPLTVNGKVDRKAIREAALKLTDVRGPQSRESRERIELSETERFIATIWRRILKVNSIAPIDHFFTIGGDSLSAVQVTIEVESSLGIQLPVHLTFEAPTLREYAGRVERVIDATATKGRSSFIFPVTSQQSDPPFFFSNPDLRLARPGLWNVPLRLYAIFHWAEGSGFAEANSLEELARFHLKNLRLIQPKGPYRIGGYSFGGLIAFEIAQQMQEQGEQVDLLFLLDPLAPQRLKQMALPAAERLSFLEWIRKRASRLVQGPREPGLRNWFLFLVPLNKVPLFAWIHYLLVSQHLRHPSAASRLLFPRNYWRAFWFNARRLVAGYEARPYSGRVLAVFSDGGQRKAVWAKLLPQDSLVRQIDTDHHHLFDSPALETWTNWLAGNWRAQSKSD